MEGHGHHELTFGGRTTGRAIEVLGPNAIGKAVGRAIDKSNRFYLVAETNQIPDRAAQATKLGPSASTAGLT